MALPDNQLSSTPIIADYLPPYDRYRTPFVDFEEGGIALYDGSQGTQVQMWTCLYEDDEDAAGYGNFTWYPESFGSPTVVLNVPDVVQMAAAFNNNMDFIIAYELKNGDCKYYFYETVNEQYETHTLPAGSRSPQVCLDDHRILQTGVNDGILGYIRSGTLYYRQERDRYTVERSLATGVGSAKLHRVGMTYNLRLKFEVGNGEEVRLSTVTGNLCESANVTGDKIEVQELYPTVVRGYMVSQMQAASDCIRGLTRVYFYDMPEIDGRMHGLLRGRPISAWIPYEDMVIGDESIFETARQQEIEYPRKMHLATAIAETDYAPTKQTSERLSPDPKVTSETTVECFLNFEPAECAQRCEVLHKSAWAELEGEAKFSVSNKYGYLVPSDVVMAEVRPGTYKRLRIKKADSRGVMISIEAVIDRLSAWSSGAVSPQINAPELPPSSLPGDTTWQYMDLPALLAANDSLHYYVSGYGSSPSWSGGILQRQEGAEYSNELPLIKSSTLGTLDEALAAAPVWFTDKTNTILVTTNKDLASVTEDDLLRGKNACLIGDEIIQFQTAVDEGGAWRLSTLLRGRMDTTPASHSIGARFVMLNNPTLVPASANLIGETFNLRLPSYGTVPSDSTPQNVTFTGRSQIEWSPVDLVANKVVNDWELSWTPRHRLGDPATPIKSTHQIGWRVYFTVGATTVFYDVESPSFIYTSADQTTDFGGNQSSFNDVSIMGLNQFTGEGDALSEAV